MIYSDLLVGAVAIALGLITMSAAIFKWEGAYQLHKVRWIESLCGRRGARLFFVVLGLLLILLGGAVALGYGLNKSRTSGHVPKFPLRDGLTKAAAAESVA